MSRAYTTCMFKYKFKKRTISKIYRFKWIYWREIWNKNIDCDYGPLVYNLPSSLPCFAIRGSARLSSDRFLDSSFIGCLNSRCFFIDEVHSLCNLSSKSQMLHFVFCLSGTRLKYCQTWLFDDVRLFEAMFGRTSARMHKDRQLLIFNLMGRNNIGYPSTRG